MLPKQKLPQNHQKLFQRLPIQHRIFFIIKAAILAHKPHQPSISPRRLLHIAITFSPQALTVIFFHLARILPPLTILVASLAIYTPTALITLIDITTYPLLITAAAFYLAYFRRRQPWAPRIFSPIPWAALRLSALAILIANLALSLPIALSTFLISAFALTASLTLMHYTTLILAADILAPRRIRTI